jgi:hypothetical protein
MPATGPAGPGTRSHGAGRRLTPPPARGEISESPDMGRALTKSVDYHASNLSVSHNGDFERGNKTSPRAEEAQAHPRPAHPDLCVYPCFPTLLHPRLARRCLLLSSSG